MKVKIKSFNIKNIGPFQNFIWNDSLPSIELNDFNIFYGDNGNGKTTIVKILKNINGEDFILDKNWDITSSEQSFSYLDIDGNKNDLSSNFKDNFIIFDKYYIKNNIGDIVFLEGGTEQNKNRGNIIINLGGFVKKEQILNKYVEIIGIIDDKNTRMKSGLDIQEIKLSNKLESNKKIIEYKTKLGAIQNKPNIEGEIEKFETEIKSLDLIIKSGENLKALEKLDEIEIIDFQEETYKNTFLDVFNSINFNYGEGNILEAIIKIIKDNNLERCLVCENDIKINGNYTTRLNNLFNHFISDKEKEISKSLENLSNIISYIKQENKELENLNAKNKLKFKKLEDSIGNSTLQYEDLTIDVEDDFTKYLENLLLEIDKKNNIKSKSIIVDLNKLNVFITALNSKINTFNENIKNINEKVEELKIVNIQDKISERNTKQAVLNEYKNGFFIKTNLESVKKYFEELEKYNLNTNNIKKLKDSRDDFKKNMNTEFKTFADKYGNFICKVLEELNSSIHIKINIKANSNTSYSRGASRCGFEFNYKNKNIVGDFSEGEKRAIALSFFFAEILSKIDEKEKIENNIKILFDSINSSSSVDEKRELGKRKNDLEKILQDLNGYFNKILVLDDPAVDFDNGHKKQIASYITKISKYFSQTFVFSHDSLFVNYLGNSCGQGKKEFWVYKTNGVSNITQFDNIKVFESYFSDIKSFLSTTSPKIEELFINTYKLRFCLEKFIRDELLGFSNPKIDNIIDTNLKNIDKLKKVNEKHIDDLKEIYNFCNNNGTHFTESEGINALSKNIKKFLEIYG